MPTSNGSVVARGSSVHLLVLLYCCITTTTITIASPLCANSDGAFVGLAGDADAYTAVAGVAYNATLGPQLWTLVEESSTGGPSHSLTGRYLQVLPDQGRTYPEHASTPGHHGHSPHLQDVAALEGVPYVEFQLRVHTPGWHTLFLRWTGGDTVGGGDSMFVTMMKDKRVVSGQRTLRPSYVPVSTTLRTIAGCCYNMKTHACPCRNEKPTNTTDCPNFISRDQAAQFGVQCPVGPGVMEFVNDPTWYLFAGQVVGNVMDFDGEPWDSTCEAEGSNTADSGSDFASWNLGRKGLYELRIYAREDGTTLDAVYVAGPVSTAPALLTRYTSGSSTLCKRNGSWGGGLASTFRYLVVGGSLIGGLLCFARTAKGAVWLEWALHSITGGSRSGVDGISREGFATYRHVQLDSNGV